MVILTSTAAVYLKNRVNRAWEIDQPSQHKPIPDEEKAELRARLQPLIVQSAKQIRAQLLPVLSKILQEDFPAKWPTFLDVTVNLLSTDDAASVLGGLHCMLALSRMYRYRGTDNREQFSQIVEVTFPQLLNIANGLVSQTSAEAWEMLHILLKVYKHAVYVSCAPLKLWVASLR